MSPRGLTGSKGLEADLDGEASFPSAHNAVLIILHILQGLNPSILLTSAAQSVSSQNTALTRLTPLGRDFPVIPETAATQAGRLIH